MLYLKKLKQKSQLSLKNLVGWKTKRRIIIFSVDDYGNVRIDSKQARNNLDKEGITAGNRFDAFDTLETKQDLEQLFDVLTSVKDQKGKNAIFTPFAVPSNIDFERLKSENFSKYYYELLPVTFDKLAALQPVAYQGAWDLWQEGLSKEILVPQFHGREHLNLKVFEDALHQKDHKTLKVLQNRSYTGISESGNPSISYTAAFDFWDFRETERFHEIIRDGLACFESVFGYAAVHFNPPGGREHSVIHKTLKENGIKYIDEPLIKKEHQGKGRYKTSINYTGKRNSLGQIIQVRNVVFEPTHKTNFDWVNQTLEQIEAAFRWNRPAIISSHRVNFCGHIDPKNREKGLFALKELLKNIVKRWPDVEFMAANELGDLISGASDEK